MKRIALLLNLLFCFCILAAQKPCSLPVFRQFDFWVGEWEAFSPDGKKGGDSRITIILDSCVVLEEWTSVSPQSGLTFSGKSFNNYNVATKQWQQTWVDNTGNTTEFLRGTGGGGSVIYYADKVTGPDGKSFKRRLTFTKINQDKVRQLGERSDDGGGKWTIEYDLEYRRKR